MAKFGHCHPLYLINFSEGQNARARALRERLFKMRESMSRCASFAHMRAVGSHCSKQSDDQPPFFLGYVRESRAQRTTYVLGCRRRWRREWLLGWWREAHLRETEATAKINNLSASARRGRQGGSGMLVKKKRRSGLQRKPKRGGKRRRRRRGDPVAKI